MKIGNCSKCDAEILVVMVDETEDKLVACHHVARLLLCGDVGIVLDIPITYPAPPLEELSSTPTPSK